MAERMTWQVKQLFPLTKEQLGDLGDWEPFAADAMGGILLKRQTIIEGDKSSHEEGMPTFAQRHGDPED